ncbi:MAG: hypothetical protein JW838_13800 [Spirochaetes bacterium]|nr:hypothetical protein [Spirochaetota bacterium]
MPDNAEHGSGKKAGDLLISIPEHVRKGLPDTFSIDDIGKIDLREAETIADEGLLFLNENDLVEGLDDFDLIPLKDEHKPAKEQKPAGTPSAVRERHAEIIEKTRDDTHPKAAPGSSDEPDAAGPPREKPAPDEDYDDGREWVPIDHLDWIDEKGRKWLSIESIETEEEKKTRPPSGESGDAEKPIETVVRPEDEGVPGEGGAPQRHAAVDGEGGEPRMAEGFVESDDEYVIWDMPEGEKTPGGPGLAPEGKPVTTPEKPLLQGEGEPSPTGAPPVIEAPGVKAADKPVPAADRRPIEDEKTESELTGVFSPVELPGETTTFVTQNGAESHAGRPGPDRDTRWLRVEEASVPTFSDTIPPSMDNEAPRVYFIDDRELTSRIEEKEETPGIDLERVTRGIIQFEEAPGYLLSESDPKADRERIATIAKEFEPDYEELFIDLDYIYRDEEIDYIYAAIVEEDYSDYIREIDEFSGARGGSAVPAAVELLGLTADEFDTIEDLLFREELKGINLYDRYHLYEFGGSGRGETKSEKQCRYLLPTEGSLVDIERDSIESDVSAGSALIFEEDVSRISEELKIKTGRTDTEAVGIVESVISPEIAAAMQDDGKPPADQVREPVESAPTAEGKGIYEDIDDITDRVIILDDEEDVDRFIRGLPEQKQVDMKTLLNYLDGLFEKLPEKVIKRFASSEYFDLYLKVLNELGV